MAASDESVKSMMEGSVEDPAVTRPRLMNAMRFLSKPTQTILLVILLAVLPLLIPGVGRVLNLKGQPYREILPSLHELISFKGSEANRGAADLPGAPALNEGPAAAIPAEVPPGARDIV